MSDQPKKSSFFEKLATFIVDKRNLIFFLYAIAIFASLITQSWVSVCNDLTEYLPETTETRRGLTLMDEEMKTYATARVLVANVTYDIARDLADQIEDIEGVSAVDFWDADKSPDDTTLPSAANKTITYRGRTPSSPSPSVARMMTRPPRTPLPALRRF